MKTRIILLSLFSAFAALQWRLHRCMPQFCLVQWNRSLYPFERGRNDRKLHQRFFLAPCQHGLLRLLSIHDGCDRIIFPSRFGRTGPDREQRDGPPRKVQLHVNEIHNGRQRQIFFHFREYRFHHPTSFHGR